MRKAAGYLIVLVLVVGLGWLIVQAGKSAPPDAEEIWSLLKEHQPEPVHAGDDAILSRRLGIRGWEVWVGNYKKHDRGHSKYEVGRRRDEHDSYREIRLYREAVSAGATVRQLWLTIAGPRGD